MAQSGRKQGRGDLSDEQWRLIEALLPRQKSDGRWNDHRVTIDMPAVVPGPSLATENDRRGSEGRRTGPRPVFGSRSPPAAPASPPVETAVATSAFPNSAGTPTVSMPPPPPLNQRVDDSSPPGDTSQRSNGSEAATAGEVNLRAVSRITFATPSAHRSQDNRR
jgi:hypothetical protein